MAAAMASESESKGLEARELPSMANPPELLQAHRQRTGGKVRTRFPPEPNGYLHVGHAKSMHMNFKLAFEKLGVPPEQRETFFRYDDTNPEAESKEYIDSLAEDVAWMGWRPAKTTYTSDYFDLLYDMAITLIREGKAYVCHQTHEEIQKCREIARAKVVNPDAEGNPNSPWRDRPVEENLREFENMKNGKYAEGEACLRLKMDMTSPNPNMWDQVAYRIKYVPHPHIGDKWCIYPTYDYTHCIIDSLEDIDYSICTLEFETRRESYYWVLEALNLYRPKVYEFARLNITYTVLSKRKLLKLVKNHYVRGWDDPRMPTIKGLRRRGYTPEILNSFCEQIGVTRNNNTVQYEKLQHVARSTLHETAPRVMAVIDPLRVVITNLDAPRPVVAPDFPHAPERGTHELTIEPEIFIDRSDFRFEDSADYFGLAPGKVCNLKYAFQVRCDGVERDASGNPTLLRVSIVDTDEKIKGNLTWVPATTSHACEVRLYNHLFTVEEPDDNWEAQLNPESEIVKAEARVDPSVSKWNLEPMKHVQFERHGFFVVDYDSTADRLVFNRTVTLKDSAPKAEGGNRSRKEEQMRQLAEKEARKSLNPVDMFKGMTDLYSRFDADGVPTHDASGQELTKNAIRKLRKEWEKQKKLYEKSNPSA